jgi:WD40 repeat protein
MTRTLAAAFLAVCLSVLPAGRQQGQAARPLLRLDGQPEVSSLAFSHDGSLLASAGSPGTVKLWEVPTGVVKRTFKGSLAGGWGGVVTVSPDGRLVGLGEGVWAMSGPTGIAGWVCLWDVATGEPLRLELSGGRAAGSSTGLTPVSSVAFGPGGRLFAFAENDTLFGRRMVTVCEPATGRAVATFREDPKAFRRDIVEVGFGPDGKVLAYLVADNRGEGEVRLWDLATGKPKGKVAVGASPTSVAFSPGGGLLACGCGDGAVRVVDVAGASLHATLSGHGDAVAAVAFAGPGRLVWAEKSGWVRSWDVPSGREVASLRGPAEVVRCVTLSGDGKLVAWANEGGVVSVAEVPAGKVR